MTEKKLSVCVVAYNHAPYIAQALDGFLMQKTDFPFQVIVGDDASTDGTTEIIRRYAEQQRRHQADISPAEYRRV